MVGDPNTGGARILAPSGNARLWYLGTESRMGTFIDWSPCPTNYIDKLPLAPSSGAPSLHCILSWPLYPICVFFIILATKRLDRRVIYNNNNDRFETQWGMPAPHWLAPPKGV